MSTKPKIPKTCILIVGMHRCGTSATAGCLFHTGFSVGKNPMESNAFNKKGHFENLILYRFNEELLETISASWKTTICLPEKWWLEDRIINKKTRLIEIIREEFQGNENIVIKDPRISKLLPFYLAALKELKIEPKIVINIRDPFEVASSLKNRDNLSVPNSLNIYTDYILSSIKLSDPFDAVILNYNALLEDPINTLEQVLNNLNINVSVKNTSGIKDFIEPKLKHQINETNGKSHYKDYSSRLYYELQKHALKNIRRLDISDIEDIGSRFYKEFKFYNGIESEQKLVINIESDNRATKFEYPVKIGLNNIKLGNFDYEKVDKILIYPIACRTSLKIWNIVAYDIENKKYKPPIH